MRRAGPGPESTGRCLGLVGGSSSGFGGFGGCHAGRAGNEKPPGSFFRATPLKRAADF